jgi:uncharacterized protein YaeQ
MALPSSRVEYRIALSQVDRGHDVTETVIAALHPSETLEHLTLRVLAWCLLYEPGLGFGPGLSTPGTPDLWAHDLTGRLTTWIECGTARAEDLRKALSHHAGAKVACVFAGPRRREELVAEAASVSHRRFGEVELWTVDPALVSALARDATRHRWAVTVVGDHLYVDADGVTVDGPVERAMLGGQA